ncbi:MAG: hypothetical protein HC853_13210 [Anaerolineae bacterium]|nr:hypothetical protein [Anaerolineae bacterium]
MWRDLNNDGMQDPGELGIPGVTVTLQTPTGTITTTTDATGNYTFTNLISGTYAVSLSNLPGGLLPTYDLDDGRGPFATLNSATGITLTTGMTRTDVDFGYVPTAFVSGRAWVDADRDGIRDGVELAGVAGVTITLLDASGNVVSSTTTAANGQYTFTNIAIGNYTISETQPAGYGSSTPNVLNVNVPLAGSVNNDFGETQSSLSGSVYYDRDANDALSAGDPRIAGVTMTLTGTDVAGNLITRTTTTDASGNYTFTNLLSGTYSVRETQPISYTDGADTVGSTGGGLVLTDTIAAVTLDAGEDATGYNFGERGFEVRGTVWVDLDKDGVLDGGEPGRLGGVQIQLVDGSGNVIGSATTDASGNYTITNVLPGTYSIVEQQPNGYGSSTPNTLSNVAVPIGGLNNQNFGETLASLAGTVYRDDNNSRTQEGVEPGIGGVSVTLTGQDVNGNAITQTATTDASGNYTFTNLLAGTYTVRETQPSSYNDGLDSVGSAGGTLGNDVVSAIGLPGGVDATDYDFGELGSNISGVVWRDGDRDGVLDGGELGRVAGVTMTLLDASGNVISTTTTASDGSYSFCCLVSGNYTLSETQPAGYGSSTPNVLNVTLPQAGLTNQNFGETTSTIGGQVWRDDDDGGTRGAGEPGLSGVLLTLSGIDINGNAVVMTTTTDANGVYTFTGLLAGNYGVTETQPGGYADGKDVLGKRRTLGNDTVSNIALPAATDYTGYDFGELGALLSGVVWADDDRDGTLDGGESERVAGVTIALLDSNGNVINTTTTASDGGYFFCCLLAGNYTISETQPAGYGSSTPNTLNVAVPTAGLPNQNFGETRSSIGGGVFFDHSNDGTQQSGEPGIGGVTVTLSGSDANGNPVNRTTTTLPDGTYVFTGLLSGTYRVIETQPITYNDGIDTVGSSGGTLANDDVSAINLGTGVDATGYTFGERGTTVSGSVWHDADGDGGRDANETTGLAGVTIDLRDSDGTIISTTTTDANGNYTFTNILPGLYSIVETQPNGYGSSTPNTLNTVNVPLAGSTGNDFGETTSIMSGGVYVDDNRNGARDGAENGIGGVTVTLTGLDANGSPVTRTTTTDASGNYTFTNLLGGTYNVTEQHPSGYGDGQDAAGTAGGAVSNDNISGVVLPAGQNASGYLFGETLASLGGVVYLDKNDDGSRRWMSRALAT